MSLCFLALPLVVKYGATRPAYLLSKELSRRGYEVIVVTPLVSSQIREDLEGEGVRVEDLRFRPLMPTLPTLDLFLRSLLKPMKVRGEGLLVGFSSFYASVRLDAYYAQGPMTKALEDMSRDLPLRYRFAYRPSAPLLRRLEAGMFRRIRGRTRLFVVNSEFCKSMYEEWGIRADAVIPPPLDCSFFRPTKSPSSDYVLTYVGVYGKETRFTVLKRVADAGVVIKAFGYKVPYLPGGLRNHPNFHFLGRVGDEELVDLYANALFTLFAFMHEPFGYIPVESMACGTPVLTYAKQGPGETVVDGVSGWLVRSDREMTEKALELWRNGYPPEMRRMARERALLYDLKGVADRWEEVLGLS